MVGVGSAPFAFDLDFLTFLLFFFRFYDVAGFWAYPDNDVIDVIDGEGFTN